MTAKEVWYMWDGEGGEPEPKTVMALLQHGAGGEIDGSEGYGFTRINWHTIAAYTLGETRERVKCGWCNGNGWKDVFATWADYIYRDSCERCQGRGYTWKLGEKK